MSGGRIEDIGARRGAAPGEESMPVDAAASSAAIGLLRTTQQHHVRLSAMADQKAGFLISGSLILLGLVVGRLGTGYTVSLITAGCVAVVALSLSILAVMPRFTGLPSHLKGDPNTLFFGVFAHIDEEEFIESHLEKLHSSHDVYAAMLRDIHQMGTSLYRTKFRYLAYAYRVVLVGMAGAFAIALIEFAVT